MFYDNAEYFQTFLCGMSQLMYLLFLAGSKDTKNEMSTRPTPFLNFNCNKVFNALKQFLPKLVQSKDTDIID